MSVEANGDNRHWRHHRKCPETDNQQENQKKLQLFDFTGLEHKFKPKLESADKSKFFFVYI